MKHAEILKGLVADAEETENTLGVLLFGSVATGMQREDSDIDLITILQTSQPHWGIDNRPVDGIKVGNIFLTYDIFLDSVNAVPYLLHPIGGAKLLFDRKGSIQPLIEQINAYFLAHPEMVEKWNGYYELLKQEKSQYGYEKTTIVDVWNALEKKYSGGKTKRRFFNAFYMTNPFIFSLLKKLM